MISYKDLGPQVGYMTVFIVEYLGPLLIYPLFILPATRALIYGTSAPYVMNATQQYVEREIYVDGHSPSHSTNSLSTPRRTAYPPCRLAFYCWVAHYVKRELETLFVHKFSHGTMPIFNIFKNSSARLTVCVCDCECV